MQAAGHSSKRHSVGFRQWGFGLECLGFLSILGGLKWQSLKAKFCQLNNCPLKFLMRGILSLGFSALEKHLNTWRMLAGI